MLAADLRQVGMLAQQHARRLARPRGEQVGLIGVEFARVVGSARAATPRLGRVEVPAGAPVRRILARATWGTRLPRHRAAAVPRDRPPSLRRSRVPTRRPARLPAPVTPTIPSSIAPSLAMSEASGRRPSSGSGESPARNEHRAVLPRRDARGRRAGPRTSTSSASSSTGRASADRRWSASDGASARASSSVLEQHGEPVPVRRIGDHVIGRHLRERLPVGDSIQYEGGQRGCGMMLCKRLVQTRTQARRRRGTTTPTRRGVKPSSAGSWSGAGVIAGERAHHRSLSEHARPYNRPGADGRLADHGGRAWAAAAGPARSRTDRLDGRRDLRRAHAS